MAISIDSLHIALEEIARAIREAAGEYRSETARLDGMASEAKEAFKGSRRYWENRTNERINGAYRAAGNELEDIGGKLDAIEASIGGLAARDGTFGRFSRKYAAEDRPVVTDLADDARFDAKVAELASKVTSLSDECGSSVKARLWQELEILLFRERRKKYADIMEFKREAGRLADVASEKLPRNAGSVKALSTSERDFKINETANETASLLIQIEEAKESSINAVAERLGARLDTILSLEEIVSIFEMDGLLRGGGELPEAMREYISLGGFGADVSVCAQYPELSEVVQRRYGPVIDQGCMSLPAIFDSQQANSFYLKASCGDMAGAKGVVLSLLFGMLRSAPASRQLCVLFDPEDRSAGFAPYLEFVRLYPEIMGGRVHTTQEQMREELQKLSNHVDEVGQTRMVGRRNIFEYNAGVPDNQEPMRTLVVMDFPKYFDEHMLDNLYNIVRNGAAFGVGVILQHNPGMVLPRGPEGYASLLGKIEQAARVITGSAGEWVLPNGISFFPADAPTADAVREFAAVYSAQIKSIRAAGLQFSKILAACGDGKADSSNGISIPIGVNENGDVQSLEFGDGIGGGTSHYALVTGSSGSGKSTLLHTIIMSAVCKYSPDNLTVFMMDFKKGTEFKIYAQRRVPHIRLLALGAMQEFGFSILHELCAEMDSRAAKFKDAMEQTHRDVRSISEYRKVTGNALARILVIADEFQDLFDENANRKVAAQCGTLMANLVSQARVFGIHFVFATQTLSRIYYNSFSIQKATLNEMHVRIGLKGTEAETDLLFGSQNSRSAYRKYTGEKGSGAYIEDDMAGSPVGFRVAYCPPEAQAELLDRVRERYPESAPGMRVFSREQVPRLADCHEFMHPEADESRELIPVYLGEPIMIGASVRIDVSRKRRGNLAVVGSSQALTERLVNLYLLNAAQASADEPEAGGKSIYFFDGGKTLGDDYSSVTKEVLRKIGDDVRTVETESDAVAAVDELYSIYEARRKNRGKKCGAIHLVIKNLQWLESVNAMLLGKKLDMFISGRAEEAEEEVFGFVPRHPNDMTQELDDLSGSLGPAEASPDMPRGIKLRTLLESGYTRGINVVVTAHDVLSLKDYIYDLLPLFPNRIVFTLSDTDAEKIIPDARTERLPDNIAIFTDSIDRTYQFKPFSYEDLLQ